MLEAVKAPGTYQTDFFPQRRVIEQDHRLVFPTRRVLPKREKKLAGAKPAVIRHGNSGSSRERGGHFLGEPEKGFHPAAVLDGERVVGRVVFRQRDFGLAEPRREAGPEGEEKGKAFHVPVEFWLRR